MNGPGNGRQLMNSPKTQAFFVCTNCHAQTGLRVSLRDYEPAGYLCDSCGESVWVKLDDLRDAKGQRLISHRPFEEETAPPDAD
jgi:hypothetical protein